MGKALSGDLSCRGSYYKGKQLLLLSLCFHGQCSPFKMGSPLNGKEFASRGANSFLLRVDPEDKEGKNENDIIATAESVPIYLTWSYDEEK